MCEFCLKHGEGKKWYLQASNYSEDLLSDIRRRRFIEDFLTDTKSIERDVKRLEKLDSAPRFVQGIVRRLVPRKMKKVHYGQVVPIEDIERIFGFVNSIVRVACICRHVTLGKEKRYCYGVSLGPNGGKLGEIVRGLDGSFLNGPDTGGMEKLGRSLPYRMDVPHSFHRRGVQLRSSRLPGHAVHSDTPDTRHVPGRVRCHG
jgi:hypothetical protein